MIFNQHPHILTSVWHHSEVCKGPPYLTVQLEKILTDPAMYIRDSGLVDPQIIIDYPGIIKLKQNQQIIRRIKNEPVTIEWPIYFKLKFSVKINKFTEVEDKGRFRNILQGL